MHAFLFLILSGNFKYPPFNIGLNKYNSNTSSIILCGINFEFYDYYSTFFI